MQTAPILLKQGLKSVSINANKTELVHYAKKRKKVDLKVPSLLNTKISFAARNSVRNLFQITMSITIPDLYVYCYLQPKLTGKTRTAIGTRIYKDTYL